MASLKAKIQIPNSFSYIYIILCNSIYVIRCNYSSHVTSSSLASDVVTRGCQFHADFTDASVTSHSTCTSAGYSFGQRSRSSKMCCFGIQERCVAGSRRHLGTNRDETWHDDRYSTSIVCGYHQRRRWLIYIMKDDSHDFTDAINDISKWFRLRWSFWFIKFRLSL